MFGDGAAYHLHLEERAEARNAPDMEPHALLRPHEPHRTAKAFGMQAFSIWSLKLAAEYIDPTGANRLELCKSARNVQKL